MYLLLKTWRTHIYKRPVCFAHYNCDIIVLPILLFFLPDLGVSPHSPVSSACCKNCIRSALYLLVTLRCADCFFEWNELWVWSEFVWFWSSARQKAEMKLSGHKWMSALSLSLLVEFLKWTFNWLSLPHKQEILTWDSSICFFQPPPRKINSCILPLC